MSFLVVGITDVMRILNGGVFNKIVHHIKVEIISVKELFINKKVLKTVGYVTLSLTMINSERSVDTDFISLLFVSSVGHELEDIFLGELFSKSDFEGADSRRSAVDGAADVILGIDVFEDNAVTEGDVLASFFRDHGFELFFFGFGPLEFFFLPFFVHLIIDFKRGRGQDLKQGLPVIMNIQGLIAHLLVINIINIVHLEIQVLISISILNSFLRFGGDKSVVDFGVSHGCLVGAETNDLSVFQYGGGHWPML